MLGKAVWSTKRGLQRERGQQWGRVSSRVEDEPISPRHHEGSRQCEEVKRRFIDFVCKPEMLTGTNLGRMGKRRGQCLIETLRSFFH